MLWNVRLTLGTGRPGFGYWIALLLCGLGSADSTVGHGSPPRAGGGSWMLPVCVAAQYKGGWDQKPTAQPSLSRVHRPLGTQSRSALFPAAPSMVEIQLGVFLLH